MKTASSILRTMNHRTNLVSILLGNGRGAFTSAPQVKFWADGPGQLFAAGEIFGDIDGDGHLDMLVARDEMDSETGSVTWLRGNGKGAFQEVPGVTLALQLRPRFVKLADINGDRRLDIIMSQSGGRIAAFLSSGNGRFTPAVGSPWQLRGDAWAIAVGDVNGDRRGDLVAATVDSVTVIVSEQNAFHACCRISISGRARLVSSRRRRHQC